RGRTVSAAHALLSGDPLTAHCRSRGVAAQRSSSVSPSTLTGTCSCQRSGDSTVRLAAFCSVDNWRWSACNDSTPQAENSVTQPEGTKGATIPRSAGENAEALPAYQPSSSRLPVTKAQGAVGTTGRVMTPSGSSSRQGVARAFSTGASTPAGFSAFLVLL